jgi:crotonobetainyl-CoA:carnitine CoA-transferase CaiB-like acyl-CoA transferase
VTADAPQPEQKTPKTFEGIQVLEFAQWAMVPSAAAVLADWGADVIRIEHPILGDPMRGLSTFDFNGVNISFEQFNRGKRSIGIDIATDRGRELVYQLVSRSDVFMTSLREPARSRLGITYSELCKINPNLVYVRGTGQGTRGPDADLAGFDTGSFWARGGIAESLRAPGAPYVAQRPAFGDVATGTMIAGATAAALLRRERFGIGGVVDLSLLGTAVWLSASDVIYADANKAYELPAWPIGRNPLVGAYEASDGRTIYLNMFDSDRYWPILCQALGRPDLGNDSRFDTFDRRSANAPAAVHAIEEALGTKSMREWVSILSAAGCVCAPVQNAFEVTEDEQVVANDYLVPHPERHDVRLVASPAQFDETSLTIAIPAPESGQHTEEILLELGYDWPGIIDFKDAGIVS